MYVFETCEFRSFAKVMRMYWKLFYPDLAELTTQERYDLDHNPDDWEATETEAINYIERYTRYRCSKN